MWPDVAWLLHQWDAWDQRFTKLSGRHSEKVICLAATAGDPELDIGTFRFEWAASEHCADSEAFTGQASSLLHHGPLSWESRPSMGRLSEIKFCHFQWCTRAHLQNHDELSNAEGDCLSDFLTLYHSSSKMLP